MVGRPDADEPGSRRCTGARRAAEPTARASRPVGSSPAGRGHAVRGAPRQLHGPLRPAARPDQQAQARHHRDRAGRRSPTSSSRTSRRAQQAEHRRGTSGRPRSSSSSPRRCSTSRPPGCCRRPGRRTRRTSPSSRRATCSSPGCCSTARSRTSRFTFAERMATAGRMTPRQAGLEPQFAALLPELVMGDHARAAGHGRRPGDGAQGAADRRPRPPARAPGQRARAGRHPRRPAAPRAGLLVPRPGGRRRLDARHRRPLPGPARAVPRGAPSPSSRPRRSASSPSAGPAPTRARSRSATSSTSRDRGRAPSRQTTTGRPAARPADDEESTDESSSTRARRGGRGAGRRAAEEQLAFDVGDFPGGARSAHRGGPHGRRRAGDRRCRSPRPSSCPSTTSRPHLAELEEEYAAQQRGFTLRQRRRWLAGLQPVRLRAGRREVPPRRPAGPAHPGLARDPGRHRLPPAGRRARGSAPCAASTSTASSAPCSPAASSRSSAPTASGGAILYGTTVVLPRAPGARQPRRAAGPRPYLPEVDVLDEIAERGRG